ncbi:hypothetical protein ALC60_14395 [Trachymyrmex zeteki]|uniref:Uncharacterized protein n=1 Tax=Mycetomoellerius zeteki TaxID=64791 RepID=A0A151WFN3_9HYME|nr:hypothetical protein ALC60_14395 [Trachymyrmex zeteki]
MHLVKAGISCKIKITQCKLSKRGFLGGLVADDLGTIENGAHSLLIVDVENDYYAPRRSRWRSEAYMYLRSLTVHESQIDSNYGRLRRNVIEVSSGTTTLEKINLLSMRFSKRQGTGPPVVDSGSTKRLNVTTGTTDTAGDREFTTRDSIEMESHRPSLELQKVYGLASVADNQQN